MARTKVTALAMLLLLTLAGVISVEWLVWSAESLPHSGLGISSSSNDSSPGGMPAPMPTLTYPIPSAHIPLAEVRSSQIRNPEPQLEPILTVISPKISRLESAVHPSKLSFAADLPAPVLLSGKPRNRALRSADESEALKLEKARSFVTSMCTDLKGNVWIATEGEGVQRFQSTGAKWHEWTQFGKKDGLGDDCGYALACDQKGRIWVGHLNHGVSVFNGLKWQNYQIVAGIGRSDSMAGPIGERVFSIKVCPVDGDVWIATNAGLTRYSNDTDSWRYYTRGEGLPSDETNCLAFNAEGDIYVGTQCDGIAMARRADDYSSWLEVRGPESLPKRPCGQGLPTSLINDLLVTKNGIICAGTPDGLAWSNDKGISWQYQRGLDWANKVRDSIASPPSGWSPPPGAQLAEDYVTKLSQDRAGNVWLGYRTCGYGRLRIAEDGHACSSIQSSASYGYVTAFSDLVEDFPFAGTYGSGIIGLQWVTNSRASEVLASSPIPLPSSAQPPDLNALNGILASIAVVNPDPNPKVPLVMPLDDDWLTEGAWLGRYGRYWCWLAAMDNVYEGYVWGAGPDSIPHSISIGPTGDLRHPNNYLRFWIAQNFFTNDYRALEIPPIYMHSRIVHGLTSWENDRRQAEWDDNGEVYRATDEGPGMVIHLAVPNDTFVVSFYEVNDDAHAGPANAKRDYTVAIKEAGHSASFQASQFLAVGRVADFWGGVYKRFLVRGPVDLQINLQRDYSFNTIFNAVMLDLSDERPVGYYLTAEQWRKTVGLLSRHDGQPDHPFDNSANDLDSISTDFAKVEKIITDLKQSEIQTPIWFAKHGRVIVVPLARWLRQNEKIISNRDYRSVEATAFYMSGLYDTWESQERANGVITARQIEKSLRWDGVTVENSGHGYDTVRASLKTEDNQPLSNGGGSTIVPAAW